MWDFNNGGALGMMLRPLPFIIFRMAVYFGIALGYILVTGAGVGYDIGGFGDEGFQAGVTFWCGFAGFGIFGAILYWAREYILYIVKAGHIAVLIGKFRKLKGHAFGAGGDAAINTDQLRQA